MKLLKLFFLSGMIFFFGNCNTKSNSDNAAEADEPVISYSKSELSALETAEGREIDVLNKEKIASLFTDNGLMVFHINDGSDIDFFKMLEKTETEFEGNFKLIHLFFNEKSTQSSVNLFIRKNNLASEAFILSDIELLKRTAQNWQGSFPAIWIKNPTEEIDLIYEQKLSEEELKTILQSVTL